MKFRNILTASILALLMASCGHPSVPTSAQQESRLPKIYPDYTDVTVPCNICPLNFAVVEGATEAVARLSYPGGELTYGEGNKIMIDASEWQDILAASKGNSIKVDVYAKVDGNWHSYKAFNINVAEEPIDQYISYRLIQPSYETYENMSICERDLTSFDEKDIYNNMSIKTEISNPCINCHSYKNYKTDNMLFHMRQQPYPGSMNFAGTMLVADGKLTKINLITEHTGNGAYPAWHPTANLIAFASGKPGQSFHTKDIAKIEVFEAIDDLILYDIDKNEVSVITELDDELEVFPTWSPDGKKLYFCSAHMEYKNDSTIEEKEAEIIQRYEEVKYDLYCVDFDISTKTFSNAEKIYDASAIGKSVTLPRVSPDGRYILFAQAAFGLFHVWHHDADIMIMDLKTHLVKNLKAVNSNRSESYPTWSSNGRWIMVDSRRDDGNYTRPYIAYFDKNGKAHKPFVVPQEDPNFYTYFLRSYNRPEFMIEPVKVSPQEFTKKAKEDAVPAVFAK